MHKDESISKNFGTLSFFVDVEIFFQSNRLMALARTLSAMSMYGFIAL